MKKIFVLQILLIVFAACSKKDNPTGIANKNFEYPLSMGNVWEYNGRKYFANFRGDSTVILIQDTTYLDLRLEVTGQELLPNNILAYELHETQAETSRVITSRTTESDSYYNNFGDGLFFYGYKGRSNIIPKTRTQIMFERNGRYLDNPIGFLADYNVDLIQTQIPDTLVLVEPASKSLQYPLTPGEMWTHSTLTGSIREVLEIVDIETPAGIFECAKVQWFVNDNIDFIDYVSTQGLVQRVITIKDLTIVTTDKPEGIGVADAISEYFLKSVVLRK